MPTKRRAAVDYDSDALDDDEPAQRKTSPQKSAKKPPKKKKRTKKEQDSDVDFDTDDDGIEVIGKLVEAPKTGQGMSGIHLHFLDVLIALASSSWANFTEHTQFFEQDDGSEMQRP